MFIDADEENYYLQRGLQLLRTGGMMAIDNAFWSGRVTDPGVSDANVEAIRALNSKLREDSRIGLATF